MNLTDSSLTFFWMPTIQSFTHAFSCVSSALTNVQESRHRVVGRSSPHICGLTPPSVQLRPVPQSGTTRGTRARSMGTATIAAMVDRGGRLRSLEWFFSASTCQFTVVGAVVVTEIACPIQTNTMLFCVVHLDVRRASVSTDPWQSVKQKIRLTTRESVDRRR